MATQTSNLRELKKKKRKKSFYKKLIIILIIVFALLIGYFTRNKWLPVFDGIVYKVSNSISKEDYKKNFPLKVSSNSKNQIATFSDRLVLLSDTNVYIYERDGKLSRSFQHGMTEPIMKTMSDRVMIYDHAGTKLVVEGRSERIFSYESDKKILFANISHKGEVAIVSQSETAASDLVVLNNKGRKILTSFFKQKIVNVSFENDSSHCILSTLFVTGGDIVTKQYSINISDGKQEWSSDNTEAFPLVSSINDKNEICLVSDLSYFVLSEKGQKKYSYDYHGELIGYASHDGLSAAILYNVNQRASEMIVFNGSASQKNIPLSGEFKKVKSVDGRIYLLTKNTFNIYSASGELISTRQLERIYDDFTVIGDYVYLIGGNEISIISLKTK